MKIISGGQTGVDRAALDVALSLGIECGGWCPEGRLAEDGRIPAHYPLQELHRGGYAERTERNVAEADATIIIHRGPLYGGTRATADFCAGRGKPYLQLDAARLTTTAAAEEMLRFIRTGNFSVLNIAGPRASEWPGGYDFAAAVLRAALADYEETLPTSVAPETGDKSVAAPVLSFVVPAHNEERELPATLRAIRRAAEESRLPFEVVVVDDASTDRTATIAEKFGARVVAVNHRHIAAVRNAGGRAARGDVLFFIDADTHVAPEHVPAALAALEAGCAGGGARIEYDDDIPAWARILTYILGGFYFAGNLGAGSFLFTTKANFARTGGFNENYYAGEEVFFSLALKKLGPFRLLRQPLITSGRKLRMHSAWRILGVLALLFVGGTWGLRSRKRLDFWYDGRREQFSR